MHAVIHASRSLAVTLAILLAAPAHAQLTPSRDAQPGTSLATAWAADSPGGEVEPSPSANDRAGETAKPQQLDHEEEESADEKDDEEEDDEEEGDEEPWRLIGEVGGGVRIYGWLDMGITGNADHPASRYNGVLVPNDREEFQFNQTYLVLERPSDTEKRCWDVGGRVDLLYGADWIHAVSVGLESHPDGSPKWNRHMQYGLALPQAYGEIGHGDLALKLGHFYTTIGYESVMAPDNFFYSMSYAWFAEPTGHTGGLMTWTASDAWTFTLGGVNGEDRFDGQSDTLAVLTGFSFAPQHERYSLAFSIMTGGEEEGILPVEGPYTYANAAFVWNVSEKFKLVTQGDSAWQQNFDLSGITAETYGLTQYLLYAINDRWAMGLRYDWFRDDDGMVLGGMRFGGEPGGNPLPLPSDNAGAVQAITAGVNYSPSKNVRLRPEIRWDWYDGEGLPLFDDRTKNSQFTVASDLILLF